MRQTVLITGASKGIGFAIAKAIAPEFERIILVARDKEHLEKAAAKLQSFNVILITADLEDPKEIQKLVEYVANEVGGLDVLVNNAGVYIGKRFDHNSPEEIAKMINLNFTAYTVLTHKLLPLLKKGKNPQIINTSSCATHAQLYGEAVYSGTKAAVTAFSNVLRKELNDEGIRITTVQPWGVDTYDVPQPDTLLHPDEVGRSVLFAVTSSPLTQIDNIDLSHINQWRGDKPDWIK